MTEKELRKLDIDEKILPLILELNKAGLSTMCSCWGHDSKMDKDSLAYITFDLNKIDGININKWKGKMGFSIYWYRKKKKT